jgi:hypothetical protein
MMITDYGFSSFWKRSSIDSQKKMAGSILKISQPLGMFW